MAKTIRKIVEDKQKEPEAPAHKKRREETQKIREMIRYGDEEEHDDDLEKFERIRRRR